MTRCFSFVSISFMKTIKEISEELNVSKTAVRKKIANLGIGNQFAKIGNQFAISEEQEKLIKQAFEKSRPQTKTETKSETNREPIGNQFAILEQELAIKNQQIEEMQKTIVRQQDSIDSLTRALEAQTALHAGQLQLALEDKKKRGLFSRFRKQEE